MEFCFCSYQPLKRILRVVYKNVKVLKSSILTATEKYVRQLFKERLPEKLYFHNLGHTEMVVSACDEICRGMQLGNDVWEITLLAAWFHDTGYTRTYQGHEEESKNIAREFLVKHGYEEGKTEKVMNCIAATQLDHTPCDITEKVICDADLYHLSSKNYFKLLEQLRKEWEVVLNAKMTDRQWRLENLNFLNKHNYCTAYAQQNLEKGKQANMKRI